MRNIIGCGKSNQNTNRGYANQPNRDITRINYDHR